MKSSEAVWIAFSIRVVGFVPNEMGELQAKDHTLRSDHVMSNSDLSNITTCFHYLKGGGRGSKRIITCVEERGANSLQEGKV